MKDEGLIKGRRQKLQRHRGTKAQRNGKHVEIIFNPV